MAKRASSVPKRRQFTLGDSKAHVTQTQGHPDSVSSDDHGFEGDRWFFRAQGPTDVVSFNRSGRVEGWSNNTGALKVSLSPGLNTTTATSFRIGSHKDDVARLEGTPYRVTAPLRRTRTSLQEERRTDRELGIGPNLDDEIIENNISGLNDDSDRDTWYFQGGTVEISFRTGRVTAWGSLDDSFNAAGRKRSRGTARAVDGEYFGIGSTKDQVSRIQGSPPSTRPREIIGEEDWHYPGGTVKFESSTGRVIYWENRDNSLMTSGIRPDYPTFSGSEFIRARRDRLEARRIRREKETSRMALYGCTGCLGLLIIGFVLIATCGAVLAYSP